VTDAIPDFPGFSARPAGGGTSLRTSLPTLLTGINPSPGHTSPLEDIPSEESALRRDVFSLPLLVLALPVKYPSLGSLKTPHHGALTRRDAKGTMNTQTRRRSTSRSCLTTRLSSTARSPKRMKPDDGSAFLPRRHHVHQLVLYKSRFGTPYCMALLWQLTR
jgi:hypothetical protein